MVAALKEIFDFCHGDHAYITVSIIIQLLQMDVVPKFTQWLKARRLDGVK